MDTVTLTLTADEARMISSAINYRNRAVGNASAQLDPTLTEEELNERTRIAEHQQLVMKISSQLAGQQVHTYTVTVTASTQDEADRVMAERLGTDEDYGFDYTVDYR